MTNYINSAIAAMLRPFARSMRYASVRAALLLVVMTVASGGLAPAAANETEARAFFTKFVAAQNSHNADDVKSMLWNSPGMLWFSRGVETRGRDAVVSRFKEYYEGTWHLEPDMSQFHVAAISDDVMQILVPIVFTRGLPAKPAQSNIFLISQTLVRDANAGISLPSCRSQTPNSNSRSAEADASLANGSRLSCGTKARASSR